jgi:hypothetical protein
VGGSAQTKAMKKVAGKLRLELAQFRELQTFVQFASDVDEATKNRINKGRIITEEHRLKLSIKAKGKVFTEEHKKNISLNHHDVSLEKNPKWRGGKSFEPYPLKWTNELREKIRSRDNYMCVICISEQVNKKLSVHHIDEDKNNCDEKNLISLCLKCHIKIHNNQEFKKQNLWIARQ